MTRRLVLAAWLLTAVLGGSFARAADAPRFAPSADKCPIVDQLAAEDRARVRCGALSVPEDYAKPNGRRIELAVAIVEPKSGKTTDPVVMLHGGPGGGDLTRYVYRLGEPLGPRTLVIFDQRGVGRSSPRLCPELGEFLFRSSVRGLSVDAETAELVLAHTICHDQLTDQKIDLTKYNTDATVADMEALRQALGFEKWKIYGVSYGTAVGLAYLRDHADRVDALVLDSVYPLDMPAGSAVVVNMMRSLHELSAACAAQPACKARFGDVEELFLKALKGVIAEPIDVPALGNSSAWADSVKVGGPAFLTVVHQLLYEHADHAALPFLIDRVAARDGEVFALLVDQFHERALEITHGQYAAVECYERFPFDSRDAYEQASAQWPLVRDNMTLIVRHFEICSHWPEKAPAPMRMPERASMPTLVLAGGWDPITPPANSKAVAELLGARYVELPYWGHGVRGARECGAPVIRAFFDRPNAAPDASCARQAKPPLFATSLIRAPAIARDLAAVASGFDIVAAPGGGLLLALLLFLFVSVGVWTVVAVTRIARNGPSAVAGFWLRPGAPLSLSALALVAAVVIAAATLALSTETSQIVFLIGLPASSLWLFALPWLAVLSAAWGGWALVFGAEKEERPVGYAIHLWLVFLSAVAAIALFFAIGLLIPDII
jgi:pimeloyl-ACP methyl ester carboxylesterase